MGLPYLTADQIRSKSEKLTESFKEGRETYFVRRGIVVDHIEKNIPKEDTLLEVGCGHGTLAATLIEKGYTNMTLVDIDDYREDFLKAQSEFASTDLSMEKLPLNDGSIDDVLAIAVLEHLENPFHFVREVSRVMKAGGQFLVTVPHIHSLRSKLLFATKGDLRGFHTKNNHIAIQTRAVFNHMFGEYFKLVKTVHSDGYIKIPIIGKSIRLKQSWPLNQLFADKVFYIFERK